jgi:ATP-binding cassette, subfamily B, bacterial CvaB/MchF/RaxB
MDAGAALHHDQKGGTMSWLDAITLSSRHKLPLILQTEAAECTLACLGMVLGYHGVVTDIAMLRSRHPISLKGISLATLGELAGREQLGVRAVRLELDELSQLRLPAILHWELNHFVVLKSVKGQQVIVHDPAVGERRLSLSEVSNAFTGVALELWPDTGFKPRNEASEVRLRDLIGQTTGFLPSLANVLMLSFALEVFALISPLFLQWITDHVAISRDVDLLTTLAIGFLIVLALQQVFGFARSWILLAISTRIRVQWKSNIMAHLLRLPVSYFQKRHLGDIISRSNAMEDIQNTMTTALVEAVFDGVLVLITLIIMFLYSPFLAWLSIAGVALYGVLRWLLYAPTYKATEEHIVRAALLSSHTLETVRGIRAIKLFGRNTQRHGAWQTLLVAQTNALLRQQKIDVWLRVGGASLSGLFTLLLMWQATHLVLANAMSIGMLLAFLSYRGQFDMRIHAFIGQIIELKMLRLYAHRLADIVLHAPEPSRASFRVSSQEALSGALHIQQLSFRYAEQEPWVLQEIDLEIPQGQSVAIVGESGCGKTTLVNLLLGALEPSSGQIRFAGLSLPSIGLERWRQHVGTVMQDDTLFAGSMIDNISFFDPKPDLNRITDCAFQAAIHDDIEAMPMGYQTLVGDMGTVLSGGQKQRVLLARALYKQPGLLILDEATSHLDIRREAQVNANLAQLSVTRILVAHRIETIGSAQRVIAFDQGRIVFDGAPDAYLRSIQA